MKRKIENISLEKVKKKRKKLPSPFEPYDKSLNIKPGDSLLLINQPARSSKPNLEIKTEEIQHRHISIVGGYPNTNNTNVECWGFDMTSEAARAIQMPDELKGVPQESKDEPNVWDDNCYRPKITDLFPDMFLEESDIPM